MSEFAKYNAKDLRALEPAVTEPLHSQMSPNAHTADLLTRSRYRAEGAQTERERIIKLLKEHPHSYWFDTRIHTCSACDIIAEIKGEQK